MEYTFKDDPEKKGLSCMWFTNDTHIPKKPVNPSWMLATPRIRNDNPWQVNMLYASINPDSARLTQMLMIH